MVCKGLYYQVDFSEGFCGFWVECLHSIHVYMHQKFFKVIVHVIIFDQWNETAH